MRLKERIRKVFSGAYGTMLSPLTLVVWGSSIAVAVVAGPFGTLESMSLFQRVVFWGLTVSISIFIGYTVRAVARAWVGHDRPALFDSLAVGLMTLVFAPFVWGLARILAGPGQAGLGSMFCYVFIVTGSVSLVRRLTPGIEPRSYGFVERKMASRRERKEIWLPPQSRLTRRLPAGARGPVLRLSACDHHVDVVTGAAVYPLRMRLRDAIDEMEPEEGYCVHRSHWVARAAIVRVERDGPQKHFLRLVNGDRVPVSRGFRVNLERAGLIADGSGIGRGRGSGPVRTATVSSRMSPASARSVLCKPPV